MKKLNLATGFTMNGIPGNDAQKMVLEFLDHRESSHATTSVWFPTAFVTQILAAKKNDKIDGVRFYFAKDNLKNTVVPVATKEGPEMSKRHQRQVHIDCFDLTQPIAYFKAETDYNDGGLYKMTCSGENCSQTVSSIPCETATKWAKAFQTDHHIANREEIINTTSVWYDISFFERLDAKLGAATRLGTLKSDGIRLYFVRNKQHRDGFVFFTTYEKDGLHEDDTTCYEIDPKFYIKTQTIGITPDDRGEECPIFCPGTTWSDCELP